MLSAALCQPAIPSLLWTVLTEAGDDAYLLVRHYDESQQPRVSRCTVTYDLGQLERIDCEHALTDDDRDELAADIDRWMAGEHTEYQVDTAAQVRGEKRFAIQRMGASGWGPSRHGDHDTLDACMRARLNLRIAGGALYAQTRIVELSTGLVLATYDDRTEHDRACNHATLKADDLAWSRLVQLGTQESYDDDGNRADLALANCPGCSSTLTRPAK